MIGPGKALDTDKYFIVCTDAIGNGLTTSPRNSPAQPRMQFPKFLIRDMVDLAAPADDRASRHRHVVAVVGPSMGGMQALQWGVSHPDFMDSLVAMVPLAKTPAWSVAVMEAIRKAIMLDPAWKGGNYTAPPEQRHPPVARHPGLPRRARAGRSHATSSPTARRAAMVAAGAGRRADQGVRRQRLDLPDLGVRDATTVGTTPGMSTATPPKRCAAIKAKTLILVGTKDLLNPEWEPRRCGAIYPRREGQRPSASGTVSGHASASGVFPADIDFLNREISAFFDSGGRRKLK